MFRQMALLAPPKKDESAAAAMQDGAEAKAAFVLSLRARGIRDLALLRALEKVPRDLFVPHRYADLAARDLSLPIGCGQTLSEPWLVARMIESLGIASHHRVLEIGTGSGYVTAILANIVTTTVVTVERFQSLSIAARVRLESLGIANVKTVFGDGLSMASDAGIFDRILVHGSVEQVPLSLSDRLAKDGKMVLGKPDPSGARQTVLFEVTRGKDGWLAVASRGACRLQPLVPGLARIL
ncbi:MAG TPA: rRNA adenine N-6-methyltransferase family protein [Methylovirgula sp.]